MVTQARTAKTMAAGWDAVTIRRLASELGVSQPVLYTAFDKRQDIVDAVALHGFAELAAALDAGDPAAAYLDFARAHPATYEAMFLMPTNLRFAAADVPAPMRVAFTALGRALGIADDIRTEIAWSLLHGLASLDRAGRLSAGAARAGLQRPTVAPDVGSVAQPGRPVAVHREPGEAG
jgi:AcrR family transcriptional regulator